MRPSKQKLIGISLSCCVEDLLGGYVNYSQVVKIISGTAVHGDEGWEELMRYYKKHRWSGPSRPGRRYAARAVALANRLRSEGKIEQPRLTRGLAPSKRNGVWVKSEKEIVWWNPLDPKLVWT